MKRKIILFDIDNTLFSGDVFREKMFSALAEKSGYPDKAMFAKHAEDIYFTIRKSGPFIPEKYCEMLINEYSLHISSGELVKVIWDEHIIKSSLYEESERVLSALSKVKDITIGIFSAGPLAFQQAKIKTIQHYFQQEHITIVLLKDKELLSLIKRYENDDLYLIDDLLQILYNAKLLDKKVYVVWIKRGWVADRQKPIDGFSPDQTITNLEEILPLFIK